MHHSMVSYTAVYYAAVKSSVLKNSIRMQIKSIPNLSTVKVTCIKVQFKFSAVQLFI
jgi:hypothetical protein